jgi:hypothetical protein
MITKITDKLIAITTLLSVCECLMFQSNVSKSQSLYVCKTDFMIFINNSSLTN